MSPPLAILALTFSVYVAGGKSITTWHGQADVSSVNFEWSRPRWRNTDLGFVLAPQIVFQPRSWFGYDYGNGNEKVRALSGSLLVRRWLGPEAKSLRPYVEVSMGPMWAEKPVPAATSRFNFVTQPGFGVVLRPRGRFPVIVGYRFVHISNGGYARRNPGLSMNEMIFGVQLLKVSP